MAARDDIYLRIMLELLAVLRRIRIEQYYDNPNFISGRGESVYSTFLRAIGFVSYSEEIEQRISLDKRIERGKTIVSKILKPKTKEAENNRAVFTSFLKSFLAQLEKYIRDTNLSQIKRIRKLIGPVVNNPRSDSKITSTQLTGDIAEDIQKVNEQLLLYNLQRDGIGQIVREIDLLSNFVGSLNSLVRSLFQVGSGNIEAGKLGPLGGPFVSIAKAQTLGYSQRLDKLIERRVALNSQLILLQRKMQYIRSGIDSITTEPMALISIVDALLFIFTEVSYTCRQCKFYSTVAVEGVSLDSQGLTEEQKSIERTRLQRAQERAANIQQALRQGDETGYCIYRASNLPTVEGGSCKSVWNLPSNDFWSASDNAEDGREDIVTRVKAKLDPRNR